MNIKKMDRAGTLVIAVMRPTDAVTEEDQRENDRVTDAIKAEFIRAVKPLIPAGWKVDVDGKIVGKG